MAGIGGIVVPTGAHATGRRTFIDVIDELARPVDASDSTTRSAAADAFRSAVRKMNRKGMWPWEIQDEDISITQNERFTTVSSAIKKPLAMHLLDESGGTRDERIDYQPYDRFIERYNLDVTYGPYVYTIPNLFETGQIRWFPTPSADDNARFTYYRVTPAPRNEQEALEIPDYATDAYIAIAWLEFLKRLPSKQRPFPITVAMSQSKDAFREISAHVNAPGDRARRMGGY
jgi:hypothetical protein